MSLIVDGRVGNIFFCSEEHRNQTLLTLSCDDNGEMTVDEKGITFHGRRSRIDIHHITRIELIPNLSRRLGGWIQIHYFNEGDEELVTNLIKLDDEVLTGRCKENTSELYQELSNYNEVWNIK
ncbi:MAG: hypothetical protein JXA22_04975 [Candidatus Thermoplasmatota archaeon]|nr:hypothetical protein [Candidatus Thermoplasmatota archaeon]